MAWITTADMPQALIAARLADKTITVDAPDFTDATGIHTVPRVVSGAFPDPVPGTVGRWVVYFLDSAYPMTLVTAADRRWTISGTDGIDAVKTYTLTANGQRDWHTLESLRAELTSLASVLGALVPGESITIKRHKDA